MDFCIVAELTNLLSYVSKKTKIVICSKDRGYDASILYLKEKYPKQLVQDIQDHFVIIIMKEMRITFLLCQR